jgi:hypothetical protein
VVIGGVIDNNERVLVHWPKYVPAKEFPDAPTHIGEAATEAHTVHGHGAHRAAAVLARAVIEAAAKDKGITTGRIKEKIEAMHQAGLIRDYIRDAADEVRHFANEMAHGDFADPVDEGEAALIMKLMDRVLDEVYEGPAQVENRKDARLAKKAAAGPVPGQATP